MRPQHVARRPRQRPQKAACLGHREIRQQPQLACCHLDLGEAPYPALGQRNLLLDRLAAEGPDADLVGADVQAHRLTARHPGERLPHRRVEVHVGGADRNRGSVQAIGQDVHPCVRAAARRERLEAELRPLAGDDRVRRAPDRRDHARRRVVAGARHPGAGEQSDRGLLGLLQEAVEEPGVTGRFTLDVAARGGQHDVRAPVQCPHFGWRRVSVYLFGDGHGRPYRRRSGRVNRFSGFSGRRESGSVVEHHAPSRRTAFGSTS